MGKWTTVKNPVTVVGNIKVNFNYPCNKDNYEYAIGRNIKYIVMHYTGNPSDSALGNVRYFQGAGRNASAHYFVDEHNVYSCVAVKDKAWHCGDKVYRHAECRNYNSIGIEMCCSGNYRVSDITKENAAILCAQLCKYLNISASDVDRYVIRHYDVTGKICPMQMVRNETEWNLFKNRVKQILGGAKVSNISAPIVNPTRPANTNISGFTPSMPVVRNGSNNWVVFNLQVILNALGYNCGKADKIFGNGTYSAVVKYQRENKLEADGIVGNATWKSLLKYPLASLKKGSEGYQVKILQALLNGYGFNCGAVDGDFGNNTHNALVKYQRDRELEADGICGPVTWKQVLS